MSESSAALTQVKADSIPVAVFTEMTGAEQEALSDLLEGVPCRLEF